VRGKMPPTEQPMLAIVGTRKATPQGKHLAEYFGRELAAAGFAIVSGLAFGIDAAAHVGALEEGGICIAVLANGLASVYPHTHERLAAKIIAGGGALVSEYSPGEPPLPYKFIERNRIISGLAKGVLVVEAPESSGSLATAEFALEQNRDVFVVPGNVTHPNFKGANELIRQGAELVTKPEDILSAYGVEIGPANVRRASSDSPEEKLIVEALESVLYPLEVDKIIEMTKLEPRIVNRTLAFLIVKKMIRETKGRYTI
jgi:DNA processing protein